MTRKMSEGSACLPSSIVVRLAALEASIPHSPAHLDRQSRYHRKIAPSWIEDFLFHLRSPDVAALAVGVRFELTEGF